MEVKSWGLCPVGNAGNPCRGRAKDLCARQHPIKCGYAPTADRRKELLKHLQAQATRPVHGGAGR